MAQKQFSPNIERENQKRQGYGIFKLYVGKSLTLRDVSMLAIYLDFSRGDIDILEHSDNPGLEMVKHIESRGVISQTDISLLVEGLKRCDLGGIATNIQDSYTTNVSSHSVSQVEALVELDYDAFNPDQLSIKVGDTITNVKMMAGGWWEGELNGKRGLFPDTFVKKTIKDDSSHFTGHPHVKEVIKKGNERATDGTRLTTYTPNADLKGKLLLESKLLLDRNPAIYQLNMRHTIKNNGDKIRKCELGQSRDDGITEKIIMVVGATGGGKTTLINGMVNYVLGVNWQDTFRFKVEVDPYEAVGISQARSQTEWITSYTLHREDGFKIPYSLTIIDTPGFANTSGIKRDKQIRQEIRSFFTTHGGEGVDHIDAIGFVTQAPILRFTPTTQFVFDQVLSLFGKDISKNIVLLVTFADGQRPPVITGIKKAHIPYETFFKFNNSAVYEETSDSDEDGRYGEMFWKMGERNFYKFFQHLNNTHSTSLVQTKDVLNERHNMDIYVLRIHEHISAGLNKLVQQTVNTQVDFYTKEVRKSLERLKKISLKSNHSSTVDYINVLIASEEQQMSPGWQARKSELEEVRKHEKLLQYIDEGFDPLKLLT